MSSIDTDQVLAQMRVLSAQAQGQPKTNDAATEQGSFSDLLQQSIDQVNQNQTHASELALAFETGQGDTSLAEVMIAMQKSKVSFEAMVQVRNKLIEAYKDVMNMPL